MHAVRADFLPANERIHPIAVRATCLRSLVPAPNDRRAQTSEPRQISAPSSSAASNPCARRESDGRRHRTRSTCFRPRSSASKFPANRAAAHPKWRACAREAISCPVNCVSSCPRFELANLSEPSIVCVLRHTRPRMEEPIPRSLREIFTPASSLRANELFHVIHECSD